MSRSLTNGENGLNSMAINRAEVRSRIQGEGEMADLIRAFAWEKTALGPIDQWSETLVTAVNLMLFSPFAGAVYWGPELTLLYNDCYLPLLEGKHPEALGSRGEQVWAEAWKQISVPILAAYEKGSSVSARAEHIPILIEGKLEDRWWTYGLNPIFENGVIRGVANPVVEDTASVVAGRELKRRQEEFETGMESAGLGLWHYDPHTGMVSADERMHRIFGSPAPNGIVDYWLDLLHPDDRDRVGEHFAGVLAGEHDYDIEYRILRNGELRWVRSKGKAVGPKGSPERLFAVIEDITERKQTEAALQQNEKLAAVGRLAATIAHEINNPLESVTNLLYLASRSDQLDEIHSYIDTAELELRRVSLIANQTLKFHRQSTKPAPEFCYDLIGDALAMFQGRIANNNITVEKKKRAEKPLQCLGGEIRQVVSNLIGNAIDSMPTGGRLLLRSREATDPHHGKRGLVLTVADTGTGMSPSVSKKAFDAFYSTKGNKGTGLGLWISNEIVGRHGGTLRFRSRAEPPGRTGTVFKVYLPYPD